MAHRTTYPMDSMFSDCVVIYAHATGAGAAELTGHDHDLVSSTRTGVGSHTLVFRHSYPAGLSIIPGVICGSTVGLKAELTAWDPAAKTATLQFTDAGVAADAGASDKLRLALIVRNSGANG